MSMDTAITAIKPNITIMDFQSLLRLGDMLNSLHIDGQRQVATEFPSSSELETSPSLQ